MCETDWALILEYLKVFMSWPPMAVIITLLLIIHFRGSIDDFIKRMVRGDIFGQKFEAAPPQPQNFELESGTESLSEKVTEEPASSPQASSQPPSQEQAPEELPLELRGDPSAETAIEYVKKNPIQTVIDYKRLMSSYNSERLFGRIFGTQISLLTHLANYPEAWFSLPQLVYFHGEHQRLTGRTEYQLPDYINFLVNSGVLVASGPPSANHYKISQSGVEFLSYIKANYPHEWDKRLY
jgi:hypothetical protein